MVICGYTAREYGMFRLCAWYAVTMSGSLFLLQVGTGESLAALFEFVDRSVGLIFAKGQLRWELGVLYVTGTKRFERKQRVPYPGVYGVSEGSMTSDNGRFWVPYCREIYVANSHDYPALTHRNYISGSFCCLCKTLSFKACIEMEVHWINIYDCKRLCTFSTPFTIHGRYRVLALRAIALLSGKYNNFSDTHWVPVEYIEPKARYSSEFEGDRLMNPKMQRLTHGSVHSAFADVDKTPIADVELWSTTDHRARTYKYIALYLNLHAHHDQSDCRLFPLFRHRKLSL